MSFCNFFKDKRMTVEDIVAKVEETECKLHLEFAILIRDSPGVERIDLLTAFCIEYLAKNAVRTGFIEGRYR